VSFGACVCPQPYQGEACESNPCNGVTCSGNGKCLALGPNSYRCECNAPYTGEFCDQSCEGICVGTFPYMCSLAQPFSYCIKNTNLGCIYQNQSGLGSNFCCLSNCYACERVTCPEPDNDCFESSKCVNGVCLPFIQRPDGSICHSKSWGTCQSGQCVAGQAPTSLPSSSTQQTQTQTGSTSQQQSETQTQPTSQQTQKTQTTSNPSQTKSSSQQTSQTNSQSTSKAFTTTTLQPNSTSIHTNETDNGVLSKIDNQLEPWKIGVIAAGSAIGVAIIVFVSVVLLKPSIRSKVFVKQKKLQFN
jgi:hypothetical protein